MAQNAMEAIPQSFDQPEVGQVHFASLRNLLRPVGEAALAVTLVAGGTALATTDAGAAAKHPAVHNKAGRNSDRHPSRHVANHRIDAPTYPLDLSANSSDSNTSSMEAIFPALGSTNVSGSVDLISTRSAVQKINYEDAHDPFALATTYELYLLRLNKQLPGAGLISTIDHEASFLSDHKVAAEKALKDADNLVAFLVPETNFAITKGQATQETAVRPNNGPITSVTGEQVPTTQPLEGFKISYNKTDPTLGKAQKGLDAKDEDLVLYDYDGTVDFNDLNYTSANTSQNGEASGGSQSNSTGKGGGSSSSTTNSKEAGKSSSVSPNPATNGGGGITKGTTNQENQSGSATGSASGGSGNSASGGSSPVTPGSLPTPSGGGGGGGGGETTTTTPETTPTTSTTTTTTSPPPTTTTTTSPNNGKGPDTNPGSNPDPGSGLGCDPTSPDQQDC